MARKSFTEKLNDYLTIASAFFGSIIGLGLFFIGMINGNFIYVIIGGMLMVVGILSFTTLVEE